MAVGSGEEEVVGEVEVDVLASSASLAAAKIDVLFAAFIGLDKLFLFAICCLCREGTDLLTAMCVKFEAPPALRESWACVGKRCSMVVGKTLVKKIRKWGRRSSLFFSPVTTCLVHEFRNHAPITIALSSSEEKEAAFCRRSGARSERGKDKCEPPLLALSRARTVFSLFFKTMEKI
jgi:hypothetical protein